MAQEKNAVYWHSKGKEAYYKKNLAEASKDFAKAIEMNPKYDSAYFHRGVVEYDKNCTRKQPMITTRL